MAVQPTLSHDVFRPIKLHGVPRIHFYEGGKRCPEDITLPSCLRALTEYLGETDYGCKHCLAQNPHCKIFCSYAFFVGITGAGSYLSWKDGWAGDNQAIFYMSPNPEAPERHALDALGYTFEWVVKQEGEDRSALFRQRIIESLERGMPVLGYGVIGPPETCLITGYDAEDDTLIGWNFFQNMPEFSNGVEYEPTGEFRKRGWYADTFCLLVVGEKKARPELKDVYRAALEWCLKVTRVPMVRPETDAPEWYRGRHNGLAAYSAWAAHLLRDDDIPADNEALLRERHTAHDMAVGHVAEARWYLSQFLIEAANPDFHPPLSMAEDLYHAAGYYAAEHDLMWKLWNLAGGIGSPEAYKKFADPAIRREMAAVILEAREKDALAADAIERTLAVWK